MTRTYHFTSPIGRVDCRLAGGETISLPVVPGILKHPRRAELFELLSSEAVARKYTRRALEVAAWQVLKQFPRGWLIDCLEEVRLSDGRLRALRFLLGLDPGVAATAES